MKTFSHAIAVIAVALALSGSQLQVRDLVHDPKITENGPPLGPIQSGAPRSEWAVNGSNYVVAYRNDDRSDPFDIVADIYYENAQGSNLRKLISVPVFMQVDDVKLVSVTGDSSSQLAFIRSSGQQDWLTIVALQGLSAHKLFDYGATTIKLSDDKPPKILAYAQSDGATETFMWCKAKQKIVLEAACTAE